MTDVFPIVPASAKPLWFIAAILIVLSVVFLALAFTAYAARNSRVEVRQGQIHLVGDFWGRAIAIDSLQLERAAILDLDRKGELSPRWRTLGTGLPGYASGWFRLQNGEKALAYLTRRDQVLYLPTSLGYALLLSAERPEELLAALRAQASG